MPSTEQSMNATTKPLDLAQFDGHTSGPWEYRPAQNYEGFSIAPLHTLPTLAAVERCGAGRMNVASFNWPGQEEPNARLIAAAPALLAECKRQREELEIANAWRKANHELG